MALDKIKVNDTTTVNTGVVYDITKAPGQSYTDLKAALGTNGNNVQLEIREGGMTVRFVSNSDNKYVQYRCTADEFTTDVTKWQGVDEEPKLGSYNLSMSSGIFNLMLNSFHNINIGSIKIQEWEPYKYIDLNGNIKSHTSSVLAINPLISLKSAYGKIKVKA